jgi:hypothetical protein
LLREIEALKPIAMEIESIFHTFKSGAPSIQKALRQVRKTGGDYILVEMVDNEAEPSSTHRVLPRHTDAQRELVRHQRDAFNQPGPSSTELSCVFALRSTLACRGEQFLFRLHHGRRSSAIGQHRP